MTPSDRRPKVLFVAPLPPPLTGQSKACRARLAALAQAADVTVVDVMRRSLRHGWRSLGHGSRIVAAARVLRRLAGRADAVYLNLSQSIAGNLKDLLLFRALGRNLSKAVLHLHGGGIGETVYGRSRLLRAWNRSALRRAKAIVVLGESLRPIFEGMVPPDRIRVVPNYADDDLFLGREEVRAKFARRPPLHVLFLSNLIPSKGWPELVEAARALENEGRDDLRFTFAGAFPDEKSRRRFLEGTRGLATVEFAGLVDGDRRREILARTHLLCLPTHYPYEGQPLCILEAYASGCAVVATDRGGIRDVFEDRIHGYRVAPRAADELAAVLRRIAQDPAEAAGIAARNREYAERFRLDHTLAGVVGILLEPAPAAG